MATVLIEPKWNVKINLQKGSGVVNAVLIEPKWNVKLKPLLILINSNGIN